MPINQTELQGFAGTAPGQSGSYAAVVGAKNAGKQTAFLSHSHKDATLAKGVQGFLQAMGWEVYIDWEDTAMPEKPNRETADRIQGKIRELDWLIFLATQNSTASRWCPWEIGYADGVKPRNAIVVLPTADRNRSYGSEYLELYRWVSPADGGGYGLFPPATSSGGVYLRDIRPIRS